MQPHDALSRFQSFSLALVSLLALFLSFVTLLLFLQSLTYRFLRREDQRPAMRETNDQRFFLFSLLPSLLFFFSLLTKSFPRHDGGRCTEQGKQYNTVGLIFTRLGIAAIVCDVM